MKFDKENYRRRREMGLRGQEPGTEQEFRREFRVMQRPENKKTLEKMQKEAEKAAKKK